MQALINFLVVGGLVLLVGFIVHAVNEAQRIRREELTAKYGAPIAELIISRKVSQGMTAEQLKESWGAPVDIDQTVMKTKVKETWKYGRIGINRFTRRVFFEGGVVVGWKESDGI